MVGQLARRVAEALVGAITWAAAVGAVMWFYDWINRWYVVVAVLLAIVTGVAIAERGRSDATAGGNTFEP